MKVSWGNGDLTIVVMKRRAALFTVAAIVICGAALRLFASSRGNLWYDELYTVWSSRLPISRLIGEEGAAGHLPVYYLLAHFWYGVSTADLWIRFISVLAGCASIVLTFLTARILFSQKAALFAAILVAISPTIIWYSADATFYSWLIFITLLSFYFLVRARIDGGWLNWSAYVIAMSLALFSYDFSPVLLFASVIYFWLSRDKGKQPLRPFAVSHAVLLGVLGLVFLVGVMYVPASGLISHAGAPLFFTKLFIGLMNIPLVMLGGPTESLSLLRFGFLALVTLMIVILLLIYRKKAFTNREIMPLAVYTAILFVLPILLDATLADRTAVYRLFVWAAPFFMMLGAVLISSIRRSSLLVFAGITLFIAALFLPKVLRQHAWNDSDWRGPLEVVSSNHQEGDVILGFPVHPFVVAVDHYLPGAVIDGGNIDSSDNNIVRFNPQGVGWSGYGGERVGQGDALSGAALAARLDQEAGDARRVWILSSDGTPPFPAAEGIDQAMSAHWEKTQTWHVGSLVAELFTRRESAGTG